MARAEKDLAKLVPVTDPIGFAEICAWLPQGWEDAMVEHRAFLRARAIRTPLDLLRLIFAYPVLKYSLPELSRWAAQQAIALIAFPSLWERYVAALPFLRWLVSKLAEELCGTIPAGLKLCPLDATTFTLPGTKTRDWLVHLLWSGGSPIGVRVTKAEGRGSGESLRHLASLPEQAVVVADRAYGTPPGIAAMVTQGRQFLVRFAFNNLPLYDPDRQQQQLDIKHKLETLQAGEVCRFSALVCAKGQQAVTVRVIAVRKTQEAAAQTRMRAIREAKRKGHTPDKLSLFTSAFFLLVTNVDEKQADDHTLAQAYRWRWQIEREFRRLKGITDIRKLPNQNDTTVEFYLLSLLCAWFIAHRIARASSFFPWGCPLYKSH